MMVSSKIATSSNLISQQTSVQCILFLAPLSFNEVLEEDPKVNRLVRSNLPSSSYMSPLTIYFKTTGGQSEALARSMRQQASSEMPDYFVPE